MVIIKGQSDLTKEDIQIDPYIPIKIKWGKWDIMKEETIYWRTGDFKKSLLELGIASNSGTLRSITLVEATDIYLDSERMIEVSLPKQKGIPVFDTNGWSEKRLDECGMLEIHLSKSSILILFSNNTIINVLENERTVFGLDVNSRLCAIQVSNLSDIESNEVRDSLEYLLK